MKILNKGFYQSVDRETTMTQAKKESETGHRSIALKENMTIYNAAAQKTMLLEALLLIQHGEVLTPFGLSPSINSGEPCRRPLSFRQAQGERS
jgi:hypothetical protein